MNYPELNRGDKGDAVRELQTHLNKVGAMLVVDGDFGSGTERGVRYAQDIIGRLSTGTVDDELWQWLESQPDPCPELATNGVAFIAKEETGGLAYYHAVTRWPHFPGLASGITIGVGYDLRFNSEDDFRMLWGDRLPDNMLDELAKDIGKPGSKKRVKELKKMDFEIPFKFAWPVFVEGTLPRFYQETQMIYPSLDGLPALCRSALVSIVFNRGNSLKGPRRREMREIRNILAQADNPALHKLKRKMILTDVEDQILSMQRLWGPSSGLHKRRQAEANLWRNGLDPW
ncbi:peptidoglycan-binding protein [Methylomarinum sp. Ch1-1]|uniref:Peptidoglycan-binding protein n=1 Tax=Methylomarinum roseum TaxID=3067653 RepID=A0AAU7NXB1_9GAMM